MRSLTLYLSSSVFLSLCCSVTWRGMWVEWLQTAVLIGLICQHMHRSWHSLMERHSTSTLWSLHSPPVSLPFSHSSTMLPCWRSPSHKTRDVNNEVIITIVKLIILRIVYSYQSENWNPAMIGMHFESSICSYRWPEGIQVLQMEHNIRFFGALAWCCQASVLMTRGYKLLIVYVWLVSWSNVAAPNSRVILICSEGAGGDLGAFNSVHSISPLCVTFEPGHREASWCLLSDPPLKSDQLGVHLDTGV